MAPCPVSDLEARLLDRYQRGFPLDPRPYARIAEEIGVTEALVIETFEGLKEKGLLARIGGTIAPHAVGWSTLAAMRVPPARLDAVAAMVSAHDAVTHNYEREHELNLWCVITGPDESAVAGVIAAIEDETGLEVFDLPMIEAYRLDLGFPLQWT